ncbi:MAG: DsbA family protein [Gemmatimonadaceae bacterium]
MTPSIFRPSPRLRRTGTALGVLLLLGCGPADPAQRTARAGGGEGVGASPVTNDIDPRVERADGARVAGAEDAPIWVVEVSDFQCPYCRDFHESTYPLLKQEYVETGKVRLAYLNLPLPNHRHAWPTAEAAMCAAAQDAFWPMHDAIFSTQLQWTGLQDVQPLLDSLARVTGLDIATWDACLTSDVMRPLIQSDYDRAVATGVNSTPSFLIMADTSYASVEKAMLVGAQPIQNFRRVLDEMLAAIATAGSDSSAS